MRRCQDPQRPPCPCRQTTSGATRCKNSPGRATPSFQVLFVADQAKHRDRVCGPFGNHKQLAIWREPNLSWGCIWPAQRLNCMRNGTQLPSPVKAKARDVVRVADGAACIQHVDEITIERHTDGPLPARRRPARERELTVVHAKHGYVVPPSRRPATVRRQTARGRPWFPRPPPVPRPPVGTARANERLPRSFRPNTRISLAVALFDAM
jgi:hypothetical protein